MIEHINKEDVGLKWSYILLELLAEIATGFISIISGANSSKAGFSAVIIIVAIISLRESASNNEEGRILFLTFGILLILLALTLLIMRTKEIKQVRIMKNKHD